MDEELRRDPSVDTGHDHPAYPKAIAPLEALPRRRRLLRYRTFEGSPRSWVVVDFGWKAQGEVFPYVSLNAILDSCLCLEPRMIGNSIVTNPYYLFSLISKPSQ
ncbi:hypothetical protein HAX54_030288 [Datura stramonium]|uniref:Uncharacterized protein n=1 Tax=Datura stramonium TaxID=4076 RepID=A0ABS8VAK0_DATST|nr:hypothetical protein [Datura stramonium]